LIGHLIQPVRSQNTEDELGDWLTPEKWPAGLLPISLVDFVAAVIPLVVKSKVVREKEL